ncbi:MAG: peptidyl-prolyl cis-trans isomerase [Spirochaetaceae bacterium]|nr:peptidyl-prolyl cis-trans isomerase [Spirochaetaceae bacterium]
MAMKRLWFLFLTGVIAAGAVFAQNEMQTVATVKLTRTEPITVKQLQNEVALMEAQAKRSLTADEKNQVLEALINQRLVLQAAERDRITVSDGELSQQIDRLRDSLAQTMGRRPTDAEFTQTIRSQYNLDMPSFREQVRRQLIMERYLTVKKENLLKTPITPTAAEIQNFYDLNKSSLVRPDTVRLSIIQVPSGDDKAKAKSLADSLAREIGTDPAKFDDVSLRQGREAGFGAGDAGYLPKNPQGEQAVGADVMRTAFSLKQGQVSGVIESARGYQILKVTESYEQKQLTLDDVIDLESKMTVRQYINAGLSQNKQITLLTQAQQEVYDELRKGEPFTIDRRYLPW